MIEASGVWRADPYRRHDDRCWDGAEWTEHAIVFGAVARTQIRRSVDSQRGRGLAIAGLVLGLVGVGMLLMADPSFAWTSTTPP